LFVLGWPRIIPLTCALAEGMPVHSHTARICRTVTEPRIHTLGGHRRWLRQHHEAREQAPQSHERKEARTLARASAADHWFPLYDASMTVPGLQPPDFSPKSTVLGLQPRN